MNNVKTLDKVSKSDLTQQILQFNVSLVERKDWIKNDKKRMLFETSLAKKKELLEEIKDDMEYVVRVQEKLCLYRNELIRRHRSRLSDYK